MSCERHRHGSNWPPGPRRPAEEGVGATLPGRARLWSEAHSSSGLLAPSDQCSLPAQVPLGSLASDRHLCPSPASPHLDPIVKVPFPTCQGVFSSLPVSPLDELSMRRPLHTAPRREPLSGEKRDRHGLLWRRQTGDGAESRLLLPASIHPPRDLSCSITAGFRKRQKGV